MERKAAVPDASRVERSAGADLAKERRAIPIERQDVRPHPHEVWADHSAIDDAAAAATGR